MQMKEVCSRTGLTERTVRFYIEKGLLSPGRSWRNGREYLDFSEGDIRALERIAALRRCFFTLEQIGTMQVHPERIDGILCDYRSGLQAETEEREEALAFATSIEGEKISGYRCALQSVKTGSGPGGNCRNGIFIRILGGWMKNLPKNGKLPQKNGLNPSRIAKSEEKERFVSLRWPLLW